MTAVNDVDGAVNEVAENAAVGTTVGVTADAVDSDATTNGITYSLVDNDGGRFAIDSGSGVVTVAGAIDREADGVTRSITVRATSDDGSFFDQIFTIAINDVDEFDVTSVNDVDGAVNEVAEMLGSVRRLESRPMRSTAMQRPMASRTRWSTTMVVGLRSIAVQVW